MKTSTTVALKDEHALSLIEGDFNADEAREQLFKLYEDNIQYHGARNFSSQIREGNPDSYSEAKLRELSDAKASAIELLKMAQEKGMKIRIESDVKVSLTRD